MWVALQNREGTRAKRKERKRWGKVWRCTGLQFRSTPEIVTVYTSLFRMHGTVPALRMELHVRRDLSATSITQPRFQFVSYPGCSWCARATPSILETRSWQQGNCTVM